MAFSGEYMVPIEEAQKMERELAQSKEANAGLMRACENLERELADKRSQINRLINVIKSRNTDKVYLDNKYNELRDEIVATREQRDALAEALELFLSRVRYTSVFMNGNPTGGTFDYRSHGFDAEVELAHKALAAMKGDSHE
jgi:chromosome segregation ATPase